MNCRWKIPIALFLVLALTVPLCLGCGDDEEKGVVTITIGEMTDITGPAGPFLYTGHYGLVDLVRYYNEEGLIPGVKLKLETYDTRLNPARTVPGYDWLRGRGVDLILGILAEDTLVMKPFAARDEVPVFCGVTHQDLIEPPGWVFCLSSLGDQVMATLLKWVSENQWDYDEASIALCLYNY